MRSSSAGTCLAPAAAQPPTEEKGLRHPSTQRDPLPRERCHPAYQAHTPRRRRRRERRTISHAAAASARPREPDEARDTHDLDHPPGSQGRCGSHSADPTRRGRRVDLKDRRLNLRRPVSPCSSRSDLRFAVTGHAGQRDRGGGLGRRHRVRGQARADLDRLRRAERSSAVGRC
jgi:hypothetical protein